jgi:hypothetical protein
MNFTPSIKIGPAISGILTITVVGMIGWSRHSAPAPAPIVVPQAAVQSDYPEPLVRVVDPAPVWASAPQATVRPTYQPVSHYYGRSNHHSRRKSAAIIGGSAAGGALIGGLAGGGKGAVIGGLVGGGGGYLYNRHRLHHHRYRR